jgi:hypothetical protein
MTYAPKAPYRRSKQRFSMRLFVHGTDRVLMDRHGVRYDSRVHADRTEIIVTPACGETFTIVHRGGHFYKQGRRINNERHWFDVLGWINYLEYHG